MRKSVVLSVALLAVLLWSLPVEARQAGPGRTSAPGGSGSGATGYVPPLVEEYGRVRVSLVGLLHTGKQDPGWRFSGQTLRDLLIVVEYRDLPAGPHTQRLKLFAPDGALYQQFTTAFEATSQPVRGKGQHVSRWERVETRLLVGDTWITEHGLYGPWRFEVYVDQAQVPTTKDQSFHLAK
jgi:hypothetical protein